MLPVRSERQRVGHEHVAERFTFCGRKPAKGVLEARHRWNRPVHIRIATRTVLELGCLHSGELTWAPNMPTLSVLVIASHQSRLLSILYLAKEYGSRRGAIFFRSRSRPALAQPSIIDRWYPCASRHDGEAGTSPWSRKRQHKEGGAPEVVSW